MEQLERRREIKIFLLRMTSGECVASIAMTEPDAGSDLQGDARNP